MRFSSLFVLVSAALGQTQDNHDHGEDASHGTNAIPSNFNSDLNYLRARADAVVPGIYVCNGPGWTNNCVWQRVKDNVCMAFPNSDDLAVGPDIGIQCMLFSGKNCDGSSTAGNTVSPGVTNFKGYQGLSKAPSSYKCKTCDAEVKNCGAPGVAPSPWSMPKFNY